MLLILSTWCMKKESDFRKYLEMSKSTIKVLPILDKGVDRQSEVIEVHGTAFAEYLNTNPQKSFPRQSTCLKKL